MPDTFGRFLRSERARKKVSLRQLEAKTGLHRSTISRIERGLHDPCLHAQLTPIANALGQGVSTLLRNYVSSLTKGKPQ